MNIMDDEIEIITSKVASTLTNKKNKTQLNQAIEIKYDGKIMGNHDDNTGEIDIIDEDGASIIIGSNNNNSGSKNNSTQYSGYSNKNSILFTGSSSCGGTGNAAAYGNSSNNSIDLCMMWLQKSITVNTIQEHVCERILKLPDRDFQFYLPQIIQVCIVNYHSVEPVVTMLLEKCRVSIIIAAQSFFLIESIVRDNNPQTFNNAKYLWKRCEMASIGLSETFPQQNQSYPVSSDEPTSTFRRANRDSDQLSDSKTLIIENWTEKIHTYQQEQQQQQSSSSSSSSISSQSSSSSLNQQEQQNEMKSHNPLSKSLSEYSNFGVEIENEYEKLEISSPDIPPLSPNSTIYGSQVINNYPKNGSKPMLASTSKNTYTFFFDILQVEEEVQDQPDSISIEGANDSFDFGSSSSNNNSISNNKNSNNSNNNSIEDVISTSPSNMSGFLFPPKSQSTSLPTSPSTSLPTSPALSRSTSFDNSTDNINSSGNNNNNNKYSYPNSPLNNSNNNNNNNNKQITNNNNNEKKVTKKFNYQPFYSEIHFINILSKIGGFLLTIPMVTDKAKQRDMRNVTLKVILKQLNDQLFSGGNMIFLPVYPPFLVLSICHEEAVCLNSRDRIPFLIVLEVKKSMDSQLYQDPNYQKETDELFEEETDSEEEEGSGEELEEKVEIEEEIEVEEEVEIVDGDHYIYQQQQQQPPSEEMNNESSSMIYENGELVRSNSSVLGESSLFSPSSSLSSNSSQNNIITKKTKRIIKKVISITKKIPRKKKKSRDLSNPIYAIFGELWKQKENRIYKSSLMSHHQGWGLISFIVKSGDDLRQEQFAMQLITQFHRIFRKSKLPLWLRPYLVIATGHDSGLIETVPDTISLDNLKKKDTAFTTLLDYFIRAYGDANSKSFQKAQADFIESLAGYSLVCYFLQIKDRHNGNILIDTRGHLIHIDYGFLLSTSPGNMNFEKAPFKLTKEFIDLMGGLESDRFKYFTYLLVAGFVEIRKHFGEFQMMLDLLLPHTNLTFFVKGGPASIESFKERFKLDLKTFGDCEDYIMTLVDQSINNWTTSSYDSYQYLTNGINV